MDISLINTVIEAPLVQRPAEQRAEDCLSLMRRFNRCPVELLADRLCLTAAQVEEIEASAFRKIQPFLVRHYATQI